MDTLQECCRPVFGRHETFHPRWGWFSKAVFAGKANPYVFQPLFSCCSWLSQGCTM